eukprot:NODE_134_length_18141_cov_0.186066.p10 type:complete len:126 gc:universal NODE_134_length_18141_cov_0.186066:8634-8257(-)
MDSGLMMLVQLLNLDFSSSNFVLCCFDIILTISVCPFGVVCIYVLLARPLPSCCIRHRGVTKISKFNKFIIPHIHTSISHRQKSSRKALSLILHSLCYVVCKTTSLYRLLMKLVVDLPLLIIEND